MVRWLKVRRILTALQGSDWQARIAAAEALAGFGESRVTT
jgi:hypothetical protein